jgi:hypothetical protein
LFTEPLLSNGSCIAAYSGAVAQQWVFMPQYIARSMSYEASPISKYFIPQGFKYSPYVQEVELYMNVNLREKREYRSIAIRQNSHQKILEISGFRGCGRQYYCLIYLFTKSHGVTAERQ